MSQWRVSREVIEMFVHPSADRLEIGNAGGHQVVTQKGLRKTGDIVIVIPHNSVLPDSPLFEGYKKYLAGPMQNRVRSQNMRGELSAAIVVEDQPEFSEVPIGEDISERMGITKYEPVVPAQLAGRVKPVSHIETGGAEITRHDVEQFNLYQGEFEPNEPVMVTEKIHGSQVIYIRTKDGRRLVSSKGLLGRMLTIDEDENNTYWRASKNVPIFDWLDEHYPDVHVQAFGEVIPTQKGYTYGFSQPTARFFRIDLEGIQLAYKVVPDIIKLHWVPIISESMPFDAANLRKLREGNEIVSGRQMHIREGIVVAPVVPRKSRKGQFPLMLKLINPAYKETGEELT